MARIAPPPTKWKAPPPPPPPGLPPTSIPTPRPTAAAPPPPPALPGRTVPRVGVTPGIGGLVTPPGPTYVPPGGAGAPPAIPPVITPPVVDEGPPPVIAPVTITTISAEGLAAWLATLGLPRESEAEALESFQAAASTLGFIGDDISEIDIAQARKEGWQPKRETQQIPIRVNRPEEYWQVTKWDPDTKAPIDGEWKTRDKWETINVPVTGYFRSILKPTPYAQTPEAQQALFAQQTLLAGMEQQTAQQQQQMQMMITLLQVWPQLNPAQRAAMSDWLGRMGIDLEGLVGAMGQMGGAPALRGTPTHVPIRQGG